MWHTEIARKALAEGVVFTAIQDPRFKQNQLSVSFLLPLEAENASANALLPMVLRRGCADYPDMTLLNRRLKELYGARLDAEVAKRGEIQILTLYCEVLDDAFAIGGEKPVAAAAALLKSVLFDPVLEGGAFRREDVEIERKKLAELIEAQLNDKMQYASRRAKEIMCAGEAYGVSEYGRREQAEAVTPRELYERYRSVLTGARTEIFLVGPADPWPCESLFAEAFRRVGRKEIIPLATQVIRAPGEVKTEIERIAVAQSKLVMGFRAGVATPEKEVPAMQLACTVFGGSPHSKLFANVREKMSLCYYCFSHFERQKGLLMVESGVEEQNYEKARDEILRQLEDMKQGRFTDDELHNAVLSLGNSYRQLNDSLTSITGWYLGQAIAGSIRTPSQAAAETAAVTREQIVEACGKIGLDTIYLLTGEKEAE